MINIEQLKTKTFETEDQFQVASNLLISQEFPRLRGKYWHTENEKWIRRIAIETKDGWRVETDEELKNRQMREGNRSKAKGMVSGIMDWLFVHNGVMFKLELKLPNGKLSDTQKDLKILFDRDCPQVPVVIAYNLYHVYLFCKWILHNDLKVNIPPNFVTHDNFMRERS
jgi:hypothetical protein